MHQKNTALSAAIPVSFTLNGKTVVGRSDQTLLEIADEQGVEIPRLCYMEGMRADGNCRTCMVEIKGERVLAPSCCRYPEAGHGGDDRQRRAPSPARRCRSSCCSRTCPRRPTRSTPSSISGRRSWTSASRASARASSRRRTCRTRRWRCNLDACIQCNRCVRACREEQVNDVIGYAFRGGHSKIVFDLDDPMGDSTCVACGECVQACPTGALMPAREVGKVVPDKQVDSVCPYCGVGCQLTYNIKGNTILYVQGKDGPANSSRLCVKGRYGFDYVQHKHRLTKPLIRKPGVPKHKDFVVDPEKLARRVPRGDVGRGDGLRGQGAARRSATPTASARWPASARPRAPTKRRISSRSWCAPASARNNVDHCTRLCHASSVAALMEGINSGAVSNQVRDVANAEVIFLIGANPTVNHPVAATFIKNAAKAGVKLIVADPRRGDLARHATYNLQFNADTDVALLNAMLHVIVEEGLVDEAFIARPHVGLRGAGREREEVLARGDGADLRHRRADDPRGGAALRHVEGRRSSCGAWASRSTCTAPTTRAA